MEHISISYIEENLEPYLKETYTFLHQHPELSTEEYETQAFIVKELERLGIPYKRMANTGVCAELTGAEPGKTILIRCDIDALPIEEQTGLDYASTRPGVMHACGHDAHTTVGLGLLTILKEREADWKGTVKVMFQPSEEVHPGGAKPMIDDGILENPKVDAAICLHTNPFLAPGKFEMKKGYMLANTDRIFVSLIGKGGHAAAPQQGIDAIAMAGQFISGTQNIVSRQTSPLDPTVITYGTVNGGFTSNVMCDRVDISGTVRTIKKETQDRIEQQIEALLQSVTSFWGGAYEYEYSRGYPACWNDPELTEVVSNAIRTAFGDDKVVEVEHPYMSGDDFSIVASHVPSVFMYWGTGSTEKENFPWHNAKYHVNLNALKYGVATAVECISALLESDKVGGEEI